MVAWMKSLKGGTLLELLGGVLDTRYEGVIDSLTIRK